MENKIIMNQKLDETAKATITSCALIANKLSNELAARQELSGQEYESSVRIVKILFRACVVPPSQADALSDIRNVSFYCPAIQPLLLVVYGLDSFHMPEFAETTKNLELTIHYGSRKSSLAIADLRFLDNPHPRSTIGEDFYARKRTKFDEGVENL